MPRPIFQQLNLSSRLPYPRSYYAGRLAWAIAYPLLFRWSPQRAFGWRRFVLRRFGAELTATSLLYRSVRIFHPWLLEIGEHTTLARDVDVYNLGKVTIGSHTIISHRVVLCAGTHDYTRPNLPLETRPVTIGSGVWVATEAFIGPGTTIGDNSVVGARAVVVRDVPPGVVVAGNPAVVLKERTMIDSPETAAADPAADPAGGTTGAPTQPPPARPVTRE